MDLHYRVNDASQLLEDYFTVKSPLTPEHINTPIEGQGKYSQTISFCPCP